MSQTGPGEQSMCYLSLYMRWTGEAGVTTAHYSLSVSVSVFPWQLKGDTNTMPVDASRKMETERDKVDI